MDKVLVRRIRGLCAEPIYFGVTEADLHREIAENCWSISASEEERNEVTPAELAAAVDEVIECRRAQVDSHERGAIFYTWFDSQACQLRCCLISGIHSKLPFRCNIEYVSSVLPIIEDFVASSEFIPWSDLSEESWSEPEDNNDMTTSLKVYAVELP